MNIPTTEALASLLDRAVSATDVADQRPGAAPSLVDMNTYRSLLRSMRASYDPSARMYAYSLRPFVRDTEVEGQLKDVIKAHLRDYIHDGHIQSAVYAIVGGSTSGFKIDNLLEHWLKIAIARGSDYAADAFLAGLTDPNVQYQKMTLIKGLRIDCEIIVSNGIRLLPLANTSTAFPHYLPEVGGPIGPRPEEFSLDTILMVDASVSPVFINPTKTVGDRSLIPSRSEVFRYEDASGDPSGFDAWRFCEALSLITGGAVRAAAWWSHLDEDHICKVRTSYGYGYAQDVFHDHVPSSLSDNSAEATVQEALSLYRARQGLEAKTGRRLAVPIDRWVRSHTDRLIVDKFIDLGISLESLYLDEVSTTELRFRLALRAAWHLGTSSSERLRLMHDFKEIYGLRSKAVHAGRVDSSPETSNTLARAQEYCRQAIIKFITDGEFPDWERLVVN